MCPYDSGGVLAGTRICMVVYSHYPMDQRVRREAETLCENGAEVHVVCLKNRNEKRFDAHNSISIYRVPMGLKRNVGYMGYFLRYFAFLFLSAFYLVGLFTRHRYKVIHVHSLPDYLVFCTAFPKLWGAKIILDLHELMPEIFATKFDLPPESGKVKLAKTIERKSVGFADHVITTSPVRERTLRARTGKNEITIIMNLPKKDIYKTREMTGFVEKHNLEKAFVLIYVGGLYKERELDVVVRAMKCNEQRIPDLRFIICGKGEEEYISKLKSLITDLGLEKHVIFAGQVPQEEVLNYVRISNVAISPYRFYPKLGGVLDGVSSTKIFEYLMVPKPVIVSNMSPAEKEFSDLILFYKSGDHKNLGDRIYEVFSNEEKFKKMAEKAQEVSFKRFDPDANERKLVDIYKKLNVN